MDNSAVAEIAVVSTNGQAPAVAQPDVETMVADAQTGILSRRVSCPPELFGEGRFIVLRPIKTKLQVEIFGIDTGTPAGLFKFQEVAASLIVDWNIVDPWSGDKFEEMTGEAIGELSDEQWAWLSRTLSSPKKKASAPTS